MKIAHSAGVSGAECGLCGAYVIVVDVIACVPAAVCNTCVGVICVNVIKRHIAVCTHAWARCGFGV